LRKCERCEQVKETRSEICFECADSVAHAVAHCTVLGHLNEALANARMCQWEFVLYDLHWAWARFTRTGDYARDGMFDRTQPCWRDSNCRRIAASILLCGPTILENLLDF
jgi:hypothetical protein